VKVDESLLRDILEEHARNPHGDIEIEKPTITGNWVSQKTGNRCQLDAKVENAKIIELSAKVEGSALAKACASIMCTELVGYSLNEALQAHAMVLDWLDHSIEPEAWPGDLMVYEALARFPERLDCAKLCWHALNSMLEN
jgi:NifU-like protein involved in Fe-S cluster formation